MADTLPGLEEFLKPRPLTESLMGLQPARSGSAGANSIMGAANAAQPKASQSNSGSLFAPIAQAQAPTQAQQPSFSQNAAPSGVARKQMGSTIDQLRQQALKEAMSDKENSDAQKAQDNYLKQLQRQETERKKAEAKALAESREQNLKQQGGKRGLNADYSFRSTSLANQLINSDDWKNIASSMEREDLTNEQLRNIEATLRNQGVDEQVIQNELENTKRILDTDTRRYKNEMNSGGNAVLDIGLSAASGLVSGAAGVVSFVPGVDWVANKTGLTDGLMGLSNWLGEQQSDQMKLDFANLDYLNRKDEEANPNRTYAQKAEDYIKNIDKAEAKWSMFKQIGGSFIPGIGVAGKASQLLGRAAKVMEAGEFVAKKTGARYATKNLIGRKLAAGGEGSKRQALGKWLNAKDGERIGAIGGGVASGTMGMGDAGQGAYNDVMAMDDNELKDNVIKNYGPAQWQHVYNEYGGDMSRIKRDYATQAFATAARTSLPFTVLAGPFGVEGMFARSSIGRSLALGTNKAANRLGKAGIVKGVASVAGGTASEAAEEGWTQFASNYGETGYTGVDLDQDVAENAALGGLSGFIGGGAIGGLESFSNRRAQRQSDLIKASKRRILDNQFFANITDIRVKEGQTNATALETAVLDQFTKAVQKASGLRFDPETGAITKEGTELTDDQVMAEMQIAFNLAIDNPEMWNKLNRASEYEQIINKLKTALSTRDNKTGKMMPGISINDYAQYSGTDVEDILNSGTLSVAKEKIRLMSQEDGGDRSHWLNVMRAKTGEELDQIPELQKHKYQAMADIVDHLSKQDQQVDTRMRMQQFLEYVTSPDFMQKYGSVLSNRDRVEINHFATVELDAGTRRVEDAQQAEINKRDGFESTAERRFAAFKENARPEYYFNGKQAGNQQGGQSQAQEDGGEGTEQGSGAGSSEQQGEKPKTETVAPDVRKGQTSDSSQGGGTDTTGQGNDAGGEGDNSTENSSGTEPASAGDTEEQGNRQPGNAATPESSGDSTTEAGTSGQGRSGGQPAGRASATPAENAGGSGTSGEGQTDGNTGNTGQETAKSQPAEVDRPFVGSLSTAQAQRALDSLSSAEKKAVKDFADKTSNKMPAEFLRDLLMMPYSQISSSYNVTSLKTGSGFSSLLSALRNAADFVLDPMRIYEEVDEATRNRSVNRDLTDFIEGELGVSSKERDALASMAAKIFGYKKPKEAQVDEQNRLVATMIADLLGLPDPLIRNKLDVMMLGGTGKRPTAANVNRVREIIERIRAERKVDPSTVDVRIPQEYIAPNYDLTNVAILFSQLAPEQREKIIREAGKRNLHTFREVTTYLRALVTAGQRDQNIARYLTGSKEVIPNTLEDIVLDVQMKLQQGDFMDEREGWEWLRNSPPQDVKVAVARSVDRLLQNPDSLLSKAANKMFEYRSGEFPKDEAIAVFTDLVTQMGVLGEENIHALVPEMMVPYQGLIKGSTRKASSDPFAAAKQAESLAKIGASASSHIAYETLEIASDIARTFAENQNQFRQDIQTGRSAAAQVQQQQQQAIDNYEAGKEPPAGTPEQRTLPAREEENTPASDTTSANASNTASITVTPVDTTLNNQSQETSSETQTGTQTTGGNAGPASGTEANQDNQDSVRESGSTNEPEGGVSGESPQQDGQPAQENGAASAQGDTNGRSPDNPQNQTASVDINQFGGKDWGALAKAGKFRAPVDYTQGDSLELNDAQKSKVRQVQDFLLQEGDSTGLKPRAIANAYNKVMPAVLNGTLDEMADARQSSNHRTLARAVRDQIPDWNAASNSADTETVIDGKVVKDEQIPKATGEQKARKDEVSQLINRRSRELAEADGDDNKIAAATKVRIAMSQGALQQLASSNKLEDRNASTIAQELLDTVEDIEQIQKEAVELGEERKKHIDDRDKPKKKGRADTSGDTYSSVENRLKLDADRSDLDARLSTWLYQTLSSDINTNPEIQDSVVNQVMEAYYGGRKGRSNAKNALKYLAAQDTAAGLLAYRAWVDFFGYDPKPVNDLRSRKNQRGKAGTGVDLGTENNQSLVVSSAGSVRSNMVANNSNLYYVENLTDAQREAFEEYIDRFEDDYDVEDMYEAIANGNISYFYAQPNDFTTYGADPSEVVDTLVDEGVFDDIDEAMDAVNRLTTEDVQDVEQGSEPGVTIDEEDVESLLDSVWNDMPEVAGIIEDHATSWINARQEVVDDPDSDPDYRQELQKELDGAPEDAKGFVKEAITEADGSLRDAPKFRDDVKRNRRVRDAIQKIFDTIRNRIGAFLLAIGIGTSSTFGLNAANVDNNTAFAQTPPTQEQVDTQPHYIPTDERFANANREPTVVSAEEIRNAPTTVENAKQAPAQTTQPLVEEGTSPDGPVASITPTVIGGVTYTNMVVDQKSYTDADMSASPVFNTQPVDRRVNHNGFNIYTLVAGLLAGGVGLNVYRMRKRSKNMPADPTSQERQADTREDRQQGKDDRIRGQELSARRRRQNGRRRSKNERERDAALERQEEIEAKEAITDKDQKELDDLKQRIEKLDEAIEKEGQTRRDIQRKGKSPRQLQRMDEIESKQARLDELIDKEVWDDAERAEVRQLREDLKRLRGEKRLDRGATPEEDQEAIDVRQTRIKAIQDQMAQINAKEGEPTEQDNRALARAQARISRLQDEINQFSRRMNDGTQGMSDQQVQTGTPTAPKEGAGTRQQNAQETVNDNHNDKVTPNSNVNAPTNGRANLQKDPFADREQRAAMVRYLTNYTNQGNATRDGNTVYNVVENINNIIYAMEDAYNDSTYSDINNPIFREEGRKWFGARVTDRDRSGAMSKIFNVFAGATTVLDNWLIANGAPRIGVEADSTLLSALLARISAAREGSFTQVDSEALKGIERQTEDLAIDLKTDLETLRTDAGNIIKAIHVLEEAAPRMFASMQEEINKARSEARKIQTQHQKAAPDKAQHKRLLEIEQELNKHAEEVEKDLKAMRDMYEGKVEWDGNQRLPGGMTRARAKEIIREARDKYGKDYAKVEKTAYDIAKAFRKMRDYGIVRGVFTQADIDNFNKAGFDNYVALYRPVKKKSERQTLEDNVETSKIDRLYGDLKPNVVRSLGLTKNLNIYRRQGSTEEAADAYTNMRLFAINLSSRIGQVPFEQAIQQTYEGTIEQSYVGTVITDEEELAELNARPDGGHMPGIVRFAPGTEQYAKSGLREKIKNIQPITAMGYDKHGVLRRFNYYFTDAAIQNEVYSNYTLNDPTNVVVMKNLASVTRFASRLTTTFKPLWNLWNWTRDSIERWSTMMMRPVYNSDGKKLGRFAASKAYLSNLARISASHEAQQEIYQYMTLGTTDTPLQKMLDEAIGRGAITLMTSQTVKNKVLGDIKQSTLEKYFSKVNNKLGGWANKTGTGRLRQSSRDLLEFYVTRLSELPQITTGLAAYMAYRDLNVNREEAANRVRDQFDPLRANNALLGNLSPLFPFLRSTVAGHYNVARTLSQYWGPGEKLWTAGFLLGSTLGMFGIYFALGAMYGDDDDGVPVLARTPIGMLGQGPTFRWGENGSWTFNVGFGVSSMAAGAAANLYKLSYGTQGVGDTALGMLGILMDNVSPTQLSSGKAFAEDPMAAMTLSFTPFFFKSVMEEAVNRRSFGGNKIYNQDTPADERDYEQGTGATSRSAKKMAKWLYETLGIDVRPETIQHTIDTYSLGPLSAVSRVLMNDSVENTFGNRPSKAPYFTALGVAMGADAGFQTNSLDYINYAYEMQDFSFELSKKTGIARTHSPEDYDNFNILKGPNQAARLTEAKLLAQGESKELATFQYNSMVVDAKRKKIIADINKMVEQATEMRENGEEPSIDLKNTFQAKWQEYEDLMRQYVKHNMGAFRALQLRDGY